MNYPKFKITMKLIKALIIILIKLVCARFYSEAALLPAILYDQLIVYVPLKTILLISITALVYVNWTIWSKGILKKVVMFFVMFLYLGIGAYLFSELAGIQSDYCIEDGDCEEGYIYKGRPIDEEYCKELKGTWSTNPKTQKTYCYLK